MPAHCRLEVAELESAVGLSAAHRHQLRLLEQRLDASWRSECERAGGPRWWRRQELADRGDGGRSLTILRSPPDYDRHAATWLGDSFGLPQRVDRIGGVLEGVEASRHVETVVGPGQVFHLADAEVALRRALTRDLERCLGRVQAGHQRTALSAEVGCQP